jgi:predicted transcriptional regulator of viral defense system
MILSSNLDQRLCKALQALGPGEFRTRDAYPLGARFGMKPQQVRQSLTRLQKADHLVRVSHGVYITMETYQAHPHWYR